MVARSRSIAILYHEKQPRKDQDAYLIAWMAKRWVEWGYEVQHLYGPTESEQADLLVVHVDMSVVPPTYLRFAERFPRTVNLGLSDIRKHRISTNLVSRDSNYTGAVIVKTDLNHGGTPEVLLAERPKPPPITLLQRVKRKLKIKDPSVIRDPKSYLVYNTIKAVPGKAFSNPALVVEKFMPEHHSGEYYHRRYFFFGNSERNEVWAGKRAVNYWDMDTISRYWREPVPPELRERRTQLGAEYGKIDYVMRGDRVEIFDVNRTPTGTPLVKDPDDAQWTREIVDELAKGITACLPEYKNL